MKDFIEQRILNAVRELLTGRVNELLAEMEFAFPVIEFGEYRGDSVTVPVVELAACERTEKERIILQDAYSVTVTFSVPDDAGCDIVCFAYADAVIKAVRENPTFDGIADRVSVTGKKYTQPKKRYCGDDWQAVIGLRVTVEELRA
jgi:hypothetical protein